MKIPWYAKQSRNSLEWELRDTVKVRSLPPEGKAECVAAIVRHNTRLYNRPTPVQRTVEELKAERLREMDSIITPLVLRYYRRATGRWAGGKTNIDVAIGMTPAASGHSTWEWSDNGKWRGTNAHLFVTVMPAWKKYVQAEGLAEAGGMLTTHAKRIKDGLWEASWVTQGRGFALKTETGFILAVDGVFFHGKSEAGCRQAAAKWGKRRVLNTPLDELVAHYGNVRVRREDASAIGACSSGLDHFIARYFPGQKDATVRELLPYLSYSPKVEAAIKYAILSKEK